MAAESMNIHQKIDLELTKQLKEMKSDQEKDIQMMIDGFNRGSLPTEGEACKMQIRSVRTKALLSFCTVKNWLVQRILWSISEFGESETIYILQNRNAELKEKQKEQKEMQQRIEYIEKEKELSDHEKFNRYSVVKGIRRNEGEGTHDNEMKRRLICNVNNVYEKFESKNNAGRWIGILVTMICTAADFSIIYSFFQTANMTMVASIRAAFVFAFILDVPPYALGILWIKRDDRKQQRQMQGGNMASEISDEEKQENILMKLVVVVFLIVFTAYLIVRVITFLGGGDFDRAFHELLTRNFKFESSQFVSADLLTTFAPLGTSVAALAVGMIRSYPYTEFVERTIAVINEGLAFEELALKEAISRCETECSNLEANIEDLKIEIWTYYKRGSSMPEDEKVFKSQIINSFYDINELDYEKTYMIGSARIRNEAELTLGNIIQALAPYIGDMNIAISMQISADEMKSLDDLWVIDGKRQGGRTNIDLENIRSKMKEVAKSRGI